MALSLCPDKADMSVEITFVLSDIIQLQRTDQWVTLIYLIRSVNLIQRLDCREMADVNMVVPCIRHVAALCQCRPVGGKPAQAWDVSPEPYQYRKSTSGRTLGRVVSI